MAYLNPKHTGIDHVWRAYDLRYRLIGRLLLYPCCIQLGQHPPKHKRKYTLCISSGNTGINSTMLAIDFDTYNFANHSLSFRKNAKVKNTHEHFWTCGSYLAITLQWESLAVGKFDEFGKSSVIRQTKTIQLSTYN